MVHLELPGYNVLVPNWIYWKEYKEKHELGEEASEVLSITRFRVPTQEETIEDIVKNSEEVLRDEVDQLKLMLPEDIIEKIAQRDPNILVKLAKFYRENLQQGATYLWTNNGVLPRRYINEMQQAIENKSHPIAETVTTTERTLVRIMAGYWSFVLRLEDETLPPKEKVIALLHEGAVNSPALGVKGEYARLWKVIGQVDLLYDCITPYLGSLRDSSKTHEWFRHNEIFTGLRRDIGSWN